MILLFERENKLLLSVKKSEWRESSQKINFYDVGNNKTVFRLQAKLNDGYIKWTGFFDDRDDADEFLYALAKDTLKYQKELWKLCFPNWHPDLIQDVVYEFATITYRTTTGAGTFTVPSDWNNAKNTIECIGGGGSGGAGDVNGSVGGAGGGAGGGGAYAKSTNVSLTRGASQNCNVGAAAGDTWLRFDTTNSAPTTSTQGILAKGGTSGGNASNTTRGSRGTGGTAAASISNSTKYSGGDSSSYVTGYADGGAAGGAGGPNGNGGNGGNTSGGAGAGGGGNGGGYTGSAASGSNGGKGGNNYLNTGGGNGAVRLVSVSVAGTNGGGGGGGAGGDSSRGAGAAGGAGIEWDSTHGSGGGGGAGAYNQPASTSTGGNGGLYGAGAGGGGGSDSSAGAGGVGAQGIIVAISYPSVGFNMPMLGM